MMKTMNELREMDQPTRNELMLDLLKERQNLRLRHGVGESMKTHRFGAIRTMIARLKTLQTEGK